MNHSHRSQSRLAKAWLLFLLAMAMGAAAVWFVFNQAGDDPVAVRVHQLAYEANGSLENENFSVGVDDAGQLRFGFQEAIPRYEEIRRLKPDEELPYRNLAIAWLTILKSSAAQEGQGGGAGAGSANVDREQAQTELLATLDELLNRFDSPVALYLEAETLNELGKTREYQVKSVEKYFAAAQGEGDHTPFWFSAAWAAEGLLVTSNADDVTLRPILEQSLRELRRLAPQNLWVINKSLVQMASERSPQLADYWEAHRPILEKAGFSSKNYVGEESYYGDLSADFAALDEALARQDWPAITRVALDLDTMMRGKLPAVNDIAELQPNPLDYLLWQFSDAVTLAAQRQVEPTADLVSVQFVAVELPPILSASPVVDFALADLDFDGHLDLFVLRESTVEVFRGPLTALEPTPLCQIPFAGRFQSLQVGFLLTVADRAGSGIKRRFTEGAGQPAGVSHLEFPQVILAGQDGIAIYQFEWTAAQGLTSRAIPQPESLEALGGVQRCWIVDFDQDADLDLVAWTDQGLRLLMNRGNNTLIDASQWLYLPEDLPPIVDVQIVDWNRDLFIDLLVQHPDGRIGLLENERHGAFRYRDLSPPTRANQVGMAVAEFDGNASWDLVTSADGRTLVQFTETVAWSKVQWSGAASGGSATAATLSADGQLFGPWQVGDFDNSGTQDLILWRDGQLHFYPTRWQGTPLARGAQRLSVAAATSSVACPRPPQRGERGDWDNDGDLDLIVLADGKLQVIRNDGGNQNNWLTVLPLGLGDNASRTNHLGIGSLFEARVGTRYFAETVTRPTVHVGLGKAERVNLARIIWTNGIPQTLLLPPGRQTAEMLCILKGSCPFVYTWDGTQWQFFSDCLWAAPIGLQSPVGGLVPTRNWEYLRLPPDSLVATDGTYRVLLTEELWEVAYFDFVQLQTIDHPSDIEVHINDKVGPPDIVQHRLYHVAEKIPPLAATDHLGRDVLPLLLAEDQRYVKSFQHRLTQGYVESHELLLEFAVDDLADHTLFLTGWIQPTDTSINVMLRQQPELPGPQFPALFVIGPDGQWQPASRAMGFPGGKTKTMAVPLDGLFPTADQRLKIVSSAEIYWDQAYVARDVPPTEIIIQTTELAAAHSYFRGTARREPTVENGPETFDAQDTTPIAVWPPVRGQLTPHGDVRDLVAEADDRLVILGTGDAVELQFKVPSRPVPPGFRRTFLLYTIGYDKDSDLHTLAGQSIEPLPVAAMRAYPHDLPGSASANQARAPLGGTDGDQPLPEALGRAGTPLGRSQSWYRFWRQIQNPQIPSAPEETKVPRASDLQ